MHRELTLGGEAVLLLFFHVQCCTSGRKSGIAEQYPRGPQEPPKWNVLLPDTKSPLGIEFGKKNQLDAVDANLHSMTPDTGPYVFMLMPTRRKYDILHGPLLRDSKGRKLEFILHQSD